MYAWTDSHRDNSAHMWVVEFFFHCSAHQDVINAHLLLFKHTHTHTKEQKNINNKISIEIVFFKFVITR